MDDWGWLLRVCHPSHFLSFAFLDLTIAPHLHLIYSLRFTLISCWRLKTVLGTTLQCSGPSPSSVVNYNQVRRSSQFLKWKKGDNIYGKESVSLTFVAEESRATCELKSTVPVFDHLEIEF